MSKSINASDMLRTIAEQETTEVEIYVRLHNSDLIAITAIKQEEDNGVLVIVLES